MGVVKNSSILMLGSASAQLIPLLTLPILTRLYEPEAIGLQALAITWATAISVIATLRLDLASVLSKTEREAERVVHATITTMLMVVPIVAMLLAFCAQFVLALIGHNDAVFWLWLLPVLSLAMSLTQLGSSIQIRHRTFGRMSLVNVINQATTQGIAIGIGAFSGWLGGMVLARVLGQMAAVATLWPLGLGPYMRTWRFSIRGFKAVISECRQFVVFNTPYSLVSTVARDAPLLIFGALASAATVGFYGLARVVMYVPVSLISVSVGPVFFREAVDHIHTPVLEQLARRLLRLGLLIPAAGFAIVVVEGPDIFVFAFGDQWRAAGEFAAVLAPAFWIALQGSWIGRVFEVTGKQRRQFVMQLISDPIVIVSVTVSMIVWNNLLVAVTVFATLTAAQALVYFFVAAHVAGFRAASLIREWIIGAVLFLTMIGTIELVARVLTHGNIWWSLLYAVAVTVTVLLILTRQLLKKAYRRKWRIQ